MSTFLTGAPPETRHLQPEEEAKAPFPGIPTTSDGAGTVVWVETHITQGACAYPITSSTTMGGGYQVEVANGKKNLWGEDLAFIEPESEHSAASTCEGFERRSLPRRVLRIDSMALWIDLAGRFESLARRRQLSVLRRRLRVSQARR